MSRIDSKRRHIGACGKAVDGGSEFSTNSIHACRWSRAQDPYNIAASGKRSKIRKQKEDNGPLIQQEAPKDIGLVRSCEIYYVMLMMDTPCISLERSKW